MLPLFLLTTVSSNCLRAQCPINIDFESGDFTGWKCWKGSVAAIAGANVITWDPGSPGLPDPSRHVMLSSFPPGNGLDPYGGFPQNCPNGSGNSIRLGNNLPGAQAEGVSYTFTIPPGQNQFNLIYYYAVVFQGPPHSDFQQPRMMIEINNLTDNTKIGCSSFEFFYSTSSPNLPGFFLSPNPGGPTQVWCKNWSATSIKLDGHAGKTIELFFKTADCTPTGHFGYAYIDVNTECSSSFIGATYCSDDAFINVSAPFGYETYTWWDAGFSTILGTAQTLNFTPPPPAGTQVAVVIDPYNGFGCRDTLYAQLLDTLTIQAQAGRDTISCNNAPVQLGENPKAGYVYSWSPVTGLSNPNISNPIATPSVTTQYVVSVTNAGGGCPSTDTVIVKGAVINNTIEIIGPVNLCSGGSQTTVLKVNPADSIQWYRNGVPIPGANQTGYNVLQSGAYNAGLFSFVGCSLYTFTYNINVFPAPTVGFNSNASSQCLKNNLFSFTNTSAVSSGTLLYEWNLGDGTTETTRDVIHSYAAEGTYIVKLIVTTDRGCKDSSLFTVNVYGSPLAGFAANSLKQCINNNQFIFTNSSSVVSGTLQYNWDLGDGNFPVTKDVTHTYTLPGIYTVKLVVTTDKGCKDSISFIVSVNPEPIAAFAVNTAQQCFTNNQFVFINGSSVPTGTLQYAWDLGDGTTAATRDVTHSYAQPGDYTVKMVVTTDKGCAEEKTTMVKIHPYASADFSVEPICTNLDLPLINKTVNNTTTSLNYLWDFGNGQTSTIRNPVYSYPSPGTYTISLSVNTNQCPLPLTFKKLDVVIDAPAPGISYAAKNAVMNFPEVLAARPIGTTVLWSPGISLDNRVSYKPSFKGINPQLYTIQFKTPSGCITVDTQLVKTYKKIEIYVPAAFTPGTSAGFNDNLRPTLMGFEKVNYFRVYNRWGKLIFQMQSDRPGWDGKVNNVPQEMQTLVWMIEAVDLDGKTHRRQGTTLLLR